MAMRRYALLFFLLILTTPLASADITAQCAETDSSEPGNITCSVEKGEYNETTPLIKLVFDEKAEEDLTLTDQRLEDGGSGAAIASSLQTTSSGNNSVNYTFSTDYLADGDYVFEFTFQDEFGNMLNGDVSFSISAHGLETWVEKPTSSYLDKPSFAMSPKDDFFFEIGLEREASCIWLDERQEVDEDTDLERQYNIVTENHRFEENHSAGFRNYLQVSSDMSMFPASYENEGDLRKLNLICKDYAGRYSYSNVQIGIDETSPSIAIERSPSTITSTSTPWSDVSIETDDRTACYTTNIDYPEGFKAQIPTNDDNGFEEQEDFNTSKEERIVANGRNYTYRFNTTCINFANLNTSQTFELTTEFEDIQRVNIRSPSGTVGDPNQDLIVGLNKEDECTYEVNGEEGDLTNFTYSNTDEEWRATQPITLNQGSNNISVQCRGIENPATQQVILDQSNPPAPTIDVKEYTCGLESTDITFSSNDTQSGIDYYNYTLTSTNWSRNGTTTSGEISPTLPSENDGEQLTITAFAVDNSGNSGEQNQATTIIANSSRVECDETPPLASLVEGNSSRERSQYVIECEDEETRCQQTFDYSTHPEETSTCTFDQTKQLDDPFVLVNDTKICYKVLDMNNNQYNTSEFINPPYAKGNNESCETNADCESNYCSEEGVCKVASCDDGLQNGWQTDVDCGGPKDSCPRCEAGDSCKENRDCAAGLQCNNGTCQERQCLNEEEQCGGECGPCSKGVECEVPSDCETRNCEDGVCVEPEEEKPGDPGDLDDPEDPSDTGEETSEDGISTVGLLLLVLGILFMVAGGGLIGYSEYYIKGGSSSTKSFKPGNIAGSKGRKSEKIMKSSNQKKSSISRDKVNEAKRKSASKQRKAKRRQLLDEFDVSKDESLKEKVKGKEKTNKDDKTKKNSTKTQSETSKKSKDIASKTEKSNKQKEKDKSSSKNRKKSSKKDSKSEEKEDESAMDRLKEFNEDNDE